MAERVAEFDVRALGLDACDIELALRRVAADIGLTGTDEELAEELSRLGYVVRRYADGSFTVAHKSEEDGETCG